MPRIIILDTFPLSSAAKPSSQKGISPGVSDLCREWVKDYLREGNQVLAPAVCYYEALRELERLKALSQIYRLRQFCFSANGHFLSITDAHLELAAKLWSSFAICSL